MTPALTFLAGAKITRCTHVIDKRFVGYATLQHVDRGGVTLSIGREHFALAGRSFWSCWDGPRIAFRAAKAHWSHRYLAFRGPLLDRWAGDGLFPIRPQPVGRGNWSKRFDDVLDLSRGVDRWTARRAINLFESILIDLAAARQQPEVTVPVREPADLAPRTLRRRFREQFGTSRRRHAITTRLAEARQLLVETDLPIKTIADELGYSDVFYFTRQFKQIVGVPPGAFRASREG
jgi:hypothetical protein